MRSEYKLLFAGGMGAGKTTAIAAVSEIPPISTDVTNSDRASYDKKLTTISLDYGRITLPSGSMVKLYGIPGQSRFRFMWPVLQQGAMGVVLLADASRPDPLAELAVFTEAFSPLLKSGHAVLGVGRLGLGKNQDINHYIDFLAEQNCLIPTFSVDVRDKEDVLLLLDTLFTQIEILEELQTTNNDI